MRHQRLDSLPDRQRGRQVGATSQVERLDRGARAGKAQFDAPRGQSLARIGLAVGQGKLDGGRPGPLIVIALDVPDRASAIAEEGGAERFLLSLF